MQSSLATAEPSRYAAQAIDKVTTERLLLEQSHFNQATVQLNLKRS